MILLIVLVRNINYERSGNGDTSKEKYLEAKKNTRKTVYRAKYKAVRCVNIMLRDEQRWDVFKIAKKMVKTN